MIVVSIDLETTGLDQAKHGICQIGAYAGPDSPHLRTDVYPGGVESDPAALAVNGFTEERIEKGLPIRAALQRLSEYLQKVPADELVCLFHNAPVDAAWLIQDFRAYGFPDKPFRRVVDNISLGFAYYGELLSGAELAKRCNVMNPRPHDALADAQAQYRVFTELFYALPGSAPKSPRPWVLRA